MDDRDLPEGKLHRGEANGVRVLLVRNDGHIRCISEVCSHLGGPLAEDGADAGALGLRRVGPLAGVGDGGLGLLLLQREPVELLGQADDLVVVGLDLAGDLGRLTLLVVEGAGARERRKGSCRHHGGGDGRDRDPGPEVHLGTPIGSLALPLSVLA